jgi:hypothetical protein
MDGAPEGSIREEAMRSMQRVLALTAGLLAVGVPGVSMAAWKFQDGGPRFAASHQGGVETVKPERVSLAPKDSVADLRSFRQLDSHAAGLAGPTGPGKPALDRSWAHRSRKSGSSIAVDTD